MCSDARKVSNQWVPYPIKRRVENYSGTVVNVGWTCDSRVLGGCPILVDGLSSPLTSPHSDIGSEWTLSTSGLRFSSRAGRSGQTEHSSATLQKAPNPLPDSTCRCQPQRACSHPPPLLLSPFQCFCRHLHSSQGATQPSRPTKLQLSSSISNQSVDVFACLRTMCVINPINLMEKPLQIYFHQISTKIALESTKRKSQINELLTRELLPFATRTHTASNTHRT
jgi:hypothetical protein